MYAKVSYQHWKCGRNCGPPWPTRVTSKDRHRVSIPVHPQDRTLQAVQWDGAIYIDKMLPFGLPSPPPPNFNAVADALHWYLNSQGIRWLYHSSPATLKSMHARQHRVCAMLGVHEWDGRTTCLTFLGIEIDTVAGQLCLRKLARLVGAGQLSSYGLCLKSKISMQAIVSDRGHRMDSKIPQ